MVTIVVTKDKVGSCGRHFVRSCGCVVVQLCSRVVVDLVTQHWLSSLGLMKLLLNPGNGVEVR